MVLEKIFVKASLFLPENLIASFERMMTQGGFAVSAREYAGYALVLSVFVAIIAFQFSSFFIGQVYAVGVGVFSFGLLMALFYLLIMLTADNRARKIEDVLPDALQMMSANIRAGMTIENAIWMAAKPELGPLEEEIRIVSGKAFGGKPITDALLDMSTRVRSRMLERAVKLLNEGMQLGGELAPLLDEVARDLKMNRMLSKEIASATTMYMIFIVFTAVIASPVMFAASVYYAQMSYFISNQQGMQTDMTSGGVAGTGGVSFGGGLTGMIAGGKKGDTITPDEVFQFAVACIILTTFFGALTLSEIRYGKLTRGLQYIPVFMITALLIFFVTNSALKSMFGFLFGG